MNYFFCLQSRGSILLPPRKLSNVVIVYLKYLITSVTENHREEVNEMRQSLTFLRQLESLQKKLTTKAFETIGLVNLECCCHNIVHSHAGSAAEQCLPVWRSSAYTRLISKPINNALSIVTGYVRSAPMDNYLF